MNLVLKGFKTLVGVNSWCMCMELETPDTGRPLRAWRLECTVPVVAAQSSMLGKRLLCTDKWGGRWAQNSNWRGSHSYPVQGLLVWFSSFKKKKKKEKKNPFIFPLDRKKTSLPGRPFYPRQVTCRQLFIKQKSGFSVAQVQVYIPSLPLLSLHILE